MDGKGRAIDNVFTERLWRSLKYENIYLKGYDPGIFPEWVKAKSSMDLIQNSVVAAKRDQKAAIRFLKKAVRQHGVPEKSNADKSGSNAADLKVFNHEHSTDIELRQVKYLNNLIEQDHRRVRQRTRPMLGFKTFMSAAKSHRRN